MKGLRVYAPSGGTAWRERAALFPPRTLQITRLPKLSEQLVAAVDRARPEGACAKSRDGADLTDPAPPPSWGHPPARRRLAVFLTLEPAMAHLGS
jgi:hypothetical protein